MINLELKCTQPDVCQYVMEREWFIVHVCSGGELCNREGQLVSSAFYPTITASDLCTYVNTSDE